MRRRQEDPQSGGTGRLAPADVQQIQFRRSLRGYDEQEVDDFLDRITEELTRLQSERSGAVTVSPPGADAGEAGRQAEEILRKAKEEAAAIIRQAEARAASSTEGGQGGGPGSEAIVGSFVSRERVFLQSLAQLVQGHAEEVKRMARESRRQGGSSSPSGAASARPAGQGAALAAAASEPSPFQARPPGEPEGPDLAEPDSPARASAARGAGAQGSAAQMSPGSMGASIASEAATSGMPEVIEVPDSDGDSDPGRSHPYDSSLTHETGLAPEIEPPRIPMPQIPLDHPTPAPARTGERSTQEEPPEEKEGSVRELFWGEE